MIFVSADGVCTVKAAVCEHVCNRNASTGDETCSCNRGFRLDVNAVNCSGMHDDDLDLTVLVIEVRPCFSSNRH